jgi:Predicted transcriptional regulator
MRQLRLTVDRMLKMQEKTRYWLAKETGLDYSTVNKYYHNRVQRYDSYVLAQMCHALDCEIGDILELAEDGKIKYTIQD